MRREHVPLHGCGGVLAPHLAFARKTQQQATLVSHGPPWLRVARVFIQLKLFMQIAGRFRAPFVVEDESDLADVSDMLDRKVLVAPAEAIEIVTRDEFND